MKTAYLIGINKEGEDTIVAKVALTKSLYLEGEVNYFIMVINGKKEIHVIYYGDKQAGKEIRKIIPIKTDAQPKERSFAYIEEIYEFNLLEKIIGDA